MAFFAMTVFGFSEMAGSMFIGLFIDKFGLKKTSFFNVFIIAAMSGVTIYSIWLQQYNWVSYVMCFLWGF